jgi:hypothetical protein
VKTYKNCTALNKGKTIYKPHVLKALYDANKKSDRDKDFIACEK